MTEKSKVLELEIYEFGKAVKGALCLPMWVVLAEGKTYVTYDPTMPSSRPPFALDVSSSVGPTLRALVFELLRTAGCKDPEDLLIPRSKKEQN